MRGALIKLALGLMILGGSSARASWIHHFEVPKPPPPTLMSFASFLAGGPSLWSHTTPRIPRGMALSRNADGSLTSGLFLDFLLYRRALDSRRFDCHHPHIGPILASYLPPLPALTPPTPTPIPHPQVVGPPPLTRPATQQVPEPSSLLIAGVLLAGVGFVRRPRGSA